MAGTRTTAVIPRVIPITEVAITTADYPYGYNNSYYGSGYPYSLQQILLSEPQRFSRDSRPGTARPRRILPRLDRRRNRSANSICHSSVRAQPRSAG